MKKNLNSKLQFKKINFFFAFNLSLSGFEIYEESTVTTHKLTHSATANETHVDLVVCL